MPLPGCEHGSCVNDDGEGHAFECNCDKGDVDVDGETVKKPFWEGAFCDKRELYYVLQQLCVLPWR